jgi:hypothetical protein
VHPPESARNGRFAGRSSLPSARRLGRPTFRAASARKTAFCRQMWVRAHRFHFGFEMAEGQKWRPAQRFRFRVSPRDKKAVSDLTALGDSASATGSVRHADTSRLPNRSAAERFVCVTNRQQSVRHRRGAVDSDRDKPVNSSG